MATVKWQGGALAVAQVQTYAFAGTWEADDLIRITIGSKTKDFTAGSTTTATVVSTLVTAWNALSSSSYPEFAEITASASTTTFTLTADTAGKSFTVTLTPLEANAGTADSQTIEGGTSATTGTTATTSSGPNDWSTAKNWSGGAVPANSDDVYLENSTDDIKYGLSQSAVTLTSLNIASSFTGTVGLPEKNADATEYYEYRTRYLTISSTTINVGSGSGSGSSRLFMNVGTAQCTLNVTNTSTGAEIDLEALIWKGTHASNVVNVYKGSVGIAVYAGETATVATLRCGHQDSVDGDVSIRCGTGTTLTTITQTGGDLTINSAATTITRTGGKLSVYGTGAITTITNNTGTVEHRSTGTVTTYVGGAGSLLDLSKSLSAKTITNCTILAGSSIDDRYSVGTYTNGVILSRCRLDDVYVNFGYNRTVTPS